MRTFPGFALIAALAAISTVGACGQSAPTGSPDAGVSAPLAASESPLQAAAPNARSSAATGMSVLEAPRPAPEQVLALWGQAIEARDWARVRALWDDGGAASGLSEKAFAARWEGLSQPRVTVGAGQQEAAAGSLYYAAPVEVTDGTRKFGGLLTIRRVNDVDGASAEQLRWHADGSVRSPWTDRH